MLGRGGLRSAVLRGVAIRPPCSVVATLLLQRGSRSGHSGVLRIHVCYCKDRGSGPTFQTGGRVLPSMFATAKTGGRVLPSTQGIAGRVTMVDYIATHLRLLLLRGNRSGRNGRLHSYACMATHES